MIPKSAFRKLAAHEIAAGWFPQIRATTITPYRSRAEAAAAEVEAIKNEKPLYNQQRHPALVEPPIAARQGSPSSTDSSAPA